MKGIGARLCTLVLLTFASVARGQTPEDFRVAVDAVWQQYIQSKMLPKDAEPVLRALLDGKHAYRRNDEFMARVYYGLILVKLRRPAAAKRSFQAARLVDPTAAPPDIMDPESEALYLEAAPVPAPTPTPLPTSVPASTPRPRPTPLPTPMPTPGVIHIEPPEIVRPQPTPQPSRPPSDEVLFWPGVEPTRFVSLSIGGSQFGTAKALSTKLFGTNQSVLIGVGLGFEEKSGLGVTLDVRAIRNSGKAPVATGGLTNVAVLLTPTVGRQLSDSVSVRLGAGVGVNVWRPAIGARGAGLAYEAWARLQVGSGLGVEGGYYGAKWSTSLLLQGPPDASGPFVRLRLSWRN